MQDIILKENIIYLTKKLNGMLVTKVENRTNNGVYLDNYYYNAKIFGDDDIKSFSSIGPYSKGTLVTKNAIAIQSVIPHNFRKITSFISDTFNIFENYDSIIKNNDKHNFISSSTTLKNIVEINSKHNRLISKLMLS